MIRAICLLSIVSAAWPIDKSGTKAPRGLKPALLLYNCLHYGVLEVSLHGRNLRLDHDDGDHLFPRIDPRLGTVGAIPAEASVGDAQAGGHAILDNAHQQPIPHAVGGP